MLRILRIIALAPLVAGLLSTPGLAVAAAGITEHIVEMTPTFQFSPKDIQIGLGDKIKWVNNTGFHSTTSGTACTPDGIWDSGVFAPGGDFSVTFGTAGLFPYFCIPHCAILNMVGSVEVIQTVPNKHTTWGRIKALYRLDVERF